MFPDKTDTLYIEDRFHSGNTLRILSWFQTCARNSATTSQLTLTLHFFEPQPIYSNFSVTQRTFASLLFDTFWSTDKHGKIEGSVTKKDLWFIDALSWTRPNEEKQSWKRWWKYATRNLLFRFEEPNVWYICLWTCSRPRRSYVQLNFTISCLLTRIPLRLLEI